MEDFSEFFSFFEKYFGKTKSSRPPVLKQAKRFDLIVF